LDWDCILCFAKRSAIIPFDGLSRYVVIAFIILFGVEESLHYDLETQQRKPDPPKRKLPKLSTLLNPFKGMAPVFKVKKDDPKSKLVLGVAIMYCVSLLK
jgi:hypothetical protein